MIASFVKYYSVSSPVIRHLHMMMIIDGLNCLNDILFAYSNIHYFYSVRSKNPKKLHVILFKS